MTKGYLKMPSNPMYAPATYEEMGKSREPSKRPVDNRTKNQRLPIKIHLCSKCGKSGGTLVRASIGYEHIECGNDNKLS